MHAIINAINPMHYVRRARMLRHLDKVLARAQFERQCAIVRGA